jgi:hypothetical protein
LPILLVVLFFLFFFKDFFVFSKILDYFCRFVEFLLNANLLFFFYIKLINIFTYKFRNGSLRLYFLNQIEANKFLGKTDIGMFIVNQEIDIPRQKSGKVYTETTFTNTLDLNFLILYIAIFLLVKEKLFFNNNIISFITKAKMKDDSIFTMHSVYTMDCDNSISD